MGGLLDGMRVLTLEDKLAMELLCHTYSTWRKAAGVIDKKGPTYEAKTDFWHNIFIYNDAFLPTPFKANRVRSAKVSGFSGATLGPDFDNFPFYPCND